MNIAKDFSNTMGVFSLSLSLFAYMQINFKTSLCDMMCEMSHKNKNCLKERDDRENKSKRDKKRNERNEINAL